MYCLAPLIGHVYFLFEPPSGVQAKYLSPSLNVVNLIPSVWLKSNPGVLISKSMALFLSSNLITSALSEYGSHVAGLGCARLSQSTLMSTLQSTPLQFFSSCECLRRMVTFPDFDPTT